MLTHVCFRRLQLENRTLVVYAAVLGCAEEVARAIQGQSSLGEICVFL